MKIDYTFHADLQCKIRKISRGTVEEVLIKPDYLEPDTLDTELIHYVKRVGERYLRVVAKKKGKTLDVITAFYDRRLLRRFKK